MRSISVVAVLVGVFCSIVHADVAVGGAAAEEFTKQCRDSSTGNLDGSWIRAEVKVKGSLPNNRLTGLIHLRLQPNFAAGTKGIDMQPR